MFCHNCGAKLVDGAKFCSFCGTLVPVEVLSMMRSTSTPESGSGSESVPEQELMTDPVQMPGPETIPKKEPVPEPAAQPEQVITNVIVTATQVQNEEIIMVNTEGMLAPISLHLSKEMENDLTMYFPNAPMVPAPDGTKRVLTVRLHVIGEVSEPQELQQKPSAPKDEEIEQVMIDLTVTSEQLRKGEVLLVNDDRMLAPLALQLSEDMKNGTRMRLSNARMAPAPNGARRELTARLHVIEAKPQPQESHKLPNDPPHAPQSGTRSTSQPSFVSEQAERKKVLISDSVPCNFIFADPGKSTDGYHFGGNDGGAVSIYSHQLILYRKSKMVGAAFGVIGSAIEGRGKQYATISREEVITFEKRYSKKGRVQDYLLHLKDGRTLKILSNNGTFVDAMDQFLQ